MRRRRECFTLAEDSIYRRRIPYFSEEGWLHKGRTLSINEYNLLDNGGYLEQPPVWRSLATAQLNAFSGKKKISALRLREEKDELPGVGWPASRGAACWHGPHTPPPRPWRAQPSPWRAESSPTSSQPPAHKQSVYWRIFKQNHCICLDGCWKSKPPCQLNFLRAAIYNAALNYGKAAVANSQKRLAPIIILYIIEEGRAASKSPHLTFGYFLFISSKTFLPMSYKIQLLETSSQQQKKKDKSSYWCLFFLMPFPFMYILNSLQTALTVYILQSLSALSAEIETVVAEKSSWDQANRRPKLGLVWRNRKKISQIIKDYLYLPFFLLIILWLYMLLHWALNFHGWHILSYLL